MNWSLIRKVLADHPNQYAYGSVQRCFRGGDELLIKSFRKEVEREGLEVKVERGVVFIVPDKSTQVVW